jgi:hypothetical protein
MLYRGNEAQQATKRELVRKKGTKTRGDFLKTKRVFCFFTKHSGAARLQKKNSGKTEV